MDTRQRNLLWPDDVPELGAVFEAPWLARRALAPDSSARPSPCAASPLSAEADALVEEDAELGIFEEALIAPCAGAAAMADAAM